MKRRKFLKAMSLSAAAFAIKGCKNLIPANKSSPPHNLPNFLIIMTDDMGWADLGCFGHPLIKTPHIDNLAAEGTKLTSCYASAAYCSPSRAGMLTGRHPHRCGIDGPIMLKYYDVEKKKYINYKHNPTHLSQNEITIPELLKQKGYATCFVGKWHLIGSPNHPTPNEQGFDHALWTKQDANPSHLNPDNFIRNGQKVGKIKGLSAQIIVDEAVNWLKNLKDPARPFCLFVWTHETHTPIQTLEKYKEPYMPPATKSQATYYGDVSHTDQAVGKLMDALDNLGKAKNTFVFFSSDNGYEHIPETDKKAFRHGSAGPLRGWKGYTYEGGIRVPGIIRWPKHTTPGSVCDQPICNTDLLPTICKITSITAPDDRAIDGCDFTPIFNARTIKRKNPIYWHQDCARNKHKIALRDGRWKFLTTRNFKSHELYDLEKDIAESTNLTKKYPELTQKLLKKTRKIHNEIMVDWKKTRNNWKSVSRHP